MGTWGGKMHEIQQQKSHLFLAIMSSLTSYHGNFRFPLFLLSYSNSFEFVMLERDTSIKLRIR